MTARVNLEGGLFGAFGLLDKESRVPFPRSWGRVTRIGLFDDLCERGHEGLVNRSGKHERREV